MGKVVLYIASSVDGFIARENGSVDWLDPFQTRDEDYGYGTFIQTIGITIMGANTYRQVLSFGGEWPYPSTQNVIVTGDPELRATHDTVNIYNGDLAELVMHAKRQTSKDIWLIGGSQLVQEFWRRGLIDELFLSIIPVMLGSGLPLFDQTGIDAKLKMKSITTYKSGVTQTRYIVKR